MIFRRRASSSPSAPEVQRVIDDLGEWEYAGLEEPPGALQWLQAWYAVQCDSEWEHGYGVEIGTLDNPGWTVKINLTGTYLEDRAYVDARIERGGHDWVRTWVSDKSFQAACGPLNLGEALTAFRTWAQGTSAD